MVVMVCPKKLSEHQTIGDVFRPRLCRLYLEKIDGTERNPTGYYRTNSRMAASSPARVSGYMRLAIICCTMLMDWV